MPLTVVDHVGVALARFTREDAVAGVRKGAIEVAHHELAQVLAALQTERRLPAYLVPSLRRGSRPC
jgi:hypothetical protein